MKSVHKIFSGAGCGKTTKLLNEVEAAFAAGAQPEMLVFTTFTRKGAEEARVRAMQKFGFPKSRLPWFRTTHAMAWHFVQDAGRIMGAEDWLAVAKATGERLTIQGFDPDGRPSQGITRGDRMVALWQKSRLLMRPLAEVFAKSTETSISISEIEFMVEAINARKKEEGCIDFTDMLEEFIRRDIKFQPTHVFVDEFQDTSPLQWEVIKKLAVRADLWVAGDDDQCIYEYAGAVPDILMDTPGRSTTLPMSHRLPVAVHNLAQRVTERITKRVAKNIACRRDEGKTEWITDPCMLDMNKGSWMMLVRNNCHSEFFEEACIRMGYAYTGGRRAPVRPDLWKAVRAWNRLCEGEMLDMADIKKVYSMLYQNKGYTRGMKKVVMERADDEIYDIAAIREQFGLLAEGEWRTVFKEAFKQGELGFLEDLHKRGELDKEPRITISSIHGVKGGEADNVVLLTDMTAATHNNLMMNPDTEHRVWYVAVTRARNALYAVRPFTSMAYDLPL